MKRLLSLFLSGVLILTFFLSPVSAFADTYGSGSYGSCPYSQGCTTGTNNPVSSALSSAGSAISSFFCSNQAPSSAPNLYQVDVTGTTAKLYFSPAGSPYDKHYVSYGQGNNSEGNGAEFATSNSKGALTYTVNLLSPSTVYTFKVRGGNGCKPGPWSNTLTIKTQTKGSKAIAKFYPKQQAKYVAAKPASWIQQAQAYVSDHLPKAAPHTGLSEAKQQKNNVTPSNSSQTHSSSWWDTTVHFFSHLF